MIETSLKKLGISLPEAPEAVGSYSPWKIVSGNLLFISGQLPVKGGRLPVKGKVGLDIGIEKGREAARITALNALAQAKAAIGDLNKIRQCIKIAGYVNSAPGFTDHPAVINGASDLLVDILGEKGRHTRIAVGVSELPMNAPVEVEFLFEVSI